MTARRDATLFGVSDLHVSYRENRALVEAMRPKSEGDWLVVSGDVGDDPADIEWTLRRLAERFAKVVWTPGNHELLTPRDETQLRGEGRYHHLVELCRRLGVVSPEDPFPVWDGPGGPATVAPLFLLYDYSFGRNVAPTKGEALKRAYDAGVVCVDEFLLDPHPYASREEWCSARILESERRLAERAPQIPVVLVSHFPLLEGPTRLLRHPEFAQWCGTIRTADWHRRYDAAAVVYGHLHIPRTSWHDGVRFEEVSLGYPREWGRRGVPPTPLRQILPGPGPT